MFWGANDTGLHRPSWDMMVHERNATQQGNYVIQLQLLQLLQLQLQLQLQLVSPTHCHLSQQP